MRLKIYFGRVGESLGNAGLSSVVIQKISAVASCRFEARNQALGS